MRAWAMEAARSEAAWSRSCRVAAESGWGGGVGRLWVTSAAATGVELVPGGWGCPDGGCSDGCSDGWPWASGVGLTSVCECRVKS